VTAVTTTGAPVAAALSALSALSSPQTWLWPVSTLLLVLYVGGFWTLSRSPLDARRRLPWVLAMACLPGLGALIWFWWRYRYYPARRAEQPSWDPNSDEAPVLPPARSPKMLTPRRYGAEGGPAVPGSRRYGAEHD
jgi:hypothetical protein